MLQCKTI